MLSVCMAVICFLAGNLALVSAGIYANQQLRRNRASRDWFPVPVLTITGIWLLVYAFRRIFVALGLLRMDTILTNPMRAAAVAAILACLIAVIVRSRRDKNDPTDKQ